MLSRRLVLALPALPLLARLARAGGRAEVWAGDDLPGPRKGSIVARRLGSRPLHVQLRRPIRPTSVELVPMDNANATYQCRVLYARQPVDQWLYLKLDGRWWRSESMGHDEHASDASFQLERATAALFAAAFGVPLPARTPLDGGLRWRWSIPPTATTHVGDPIVVTLRVTNDGPTTVGFAVGGRQRGARDNRFAFAIRRNGDPVPSIDAPDFGGVMGYRVLAPGDSLDLRADLRSWAALDLPGHYAVDALYEGELAKDGKVPMTAAERANVWDVALGGQGGLLIK